MDMNAHQPPIRSLILLGGDSTRMGSPKYLLPIPSTVSEIGEETSLLIHSLCLHHIFQVKHGDPLLRTVTLSVRDDGQREDVKKLLEKHEFDLPIDLKVTYVQDSHADAGPAAGMIAAWRLDGKAHWLVSSCDYPQVTKFTLEELRKKHHQARKTVTCFVNSAGDSEPLLAIWTTSSLTRLSQVMDETGSTTPDAVLKILEQGDDSSTASQDHYSQGVMKVVPSTEDWITRVNTKEEWSAVESHLKHEFSSSDP